MWGLYYPTPCPSHCRPKVLKPLTVFISINVSCQGTCSSEGWCSILCSELGIITRTINDFSDCQFETFTFSFMYITVPATFAIVRKPYVPGKLIIFLYTLVCLHQDINVQQGTRAQTNHAFPLTMLSQYKHLQKHMYQAQVPPTLCKPSWNKTASNAKRCSYTEIHWNCSMNLK